MGILMTLFYFIITIGVLVFIHEFGHFITAKLSGMRVDRFSIGFPPRAFGKKIGDTDYCVSWIPIGGYVKIAGMIDESMDTEFLGHEPQPWEFRAKSTPKKLLVLSAGVIMNVLLAIAIFWGINLKQGKSIRETTEIGVVVPKSPAADAGLHAGDQILTINGKPVHDWDQVQSLVYLENIGNDLALTVARNGSEQTVTIPRKALAASPEERVGILPAYTAVLITNVEPNQPAAQMGIRPSDLITQINGIPVTNTGQVIDIVSAGAGKKIIVRYKRGEQELAGTGTVRKDARIGIGLVDAYTGPVRHEAYNVFTAIPEAVKVAAEATRVFVKSIWQIIVGKIPFSKAVGGPIKIAQYATQSAEIGFVSYLSFMALLSMSLALLNILPFPGLDGGHFVMVLIERITGKEIPTKIKVVVQQVGFYILLLFMAFVLYNDIANL